MIKIGKKWYNEKNLTTTDKIKLGIEKAKEPKAEKPKYKKDGK